MCRGRAVPLGLYGGVKLGLHLAELFFRLEMELSETRRVRSKRSE